MVKRKIIYLLLVLDFFLDFLDFLDFFEVLLRFLRLDPLVLLVNLMRLGGGEYSSKESLPGRDLDFPIEVRPGDKTSTESLPGRDSDFVDSDLCFFRIPFT
jgi:hypothetical protein